MSYTLVQLFKHLDEQTLKLENLGDDNDQAFLASLQLEKLTCNMDHARRILLDLEASKAPGRGSGDRLRLQQLNGRIQGIQHKVRAMQQRELATAQQRQKEASTDVQEAGSLLKQRRQSKAIMSAQEKLSVQKDVQETLSTEILGMVSNLKANAVAFADKLGQDTAVVQDAADALNRSSGMLDKVGSRLNQYRQTGAIGWWFYIWAVVFMVVALIGGMIVIRLFPKW
jgi:SNARE protein 1